MLSRRNLIREQKEEQAWLVANSRREDFAQERRVRGTRCEERMRLSEGTLRSGSGMSENATPSRNTRTPGALSDTADEVDAVGCSGRTGRTGRSVEQAEHCYSPAERNTTLHTGLKGKRRRWYKKRSRRDYGRVEAKA